MYYNRFGHFFVVLENSNLFSFLVDCLNCKCVNYKYAKKQKTKQMKTERYASLLQTFEGSVVILRDL